MKKPTKPEREVNVKKVWWLPEIPNEYDENRNFTLAQYLEGVDELCKQHNLTYDDLQMFDGTQGYDYYSADIGLEYVLDLEPEKDYTERLEEYEKQLETWKKNKEKHRQKLREELEKKKKMVDKQTEKIQNIEKLLKELDETE